jgi:hypothetical protein
VNSALVAGLLICAVGPVTSAVASTLGILGTMTPLAVPLMNRGELGGAAMVVTAPLVTWLIFIVAAG